MTADAPHAAETERFGQEVEAPRGRLLFGLIPRSRVARWTAVGAVLFIAVAILLYLSIAVLPARIVERPPELEGLTGNPRVQAENALEQTRNSVRTTLIQAVGGGLLFLTFAVALGQLYTAREGQVVDRFTSSIGQLGDDKVDVRLGGVYALRQIAERYEYRRPIAEIFVAYLKIHSLEPASVATAVETAPASFADEQQRFVLGSTKKGEPVPLRPDLQAVLRILVGEELWKRAGISRLDLSYIVVRNADLGGVDLSNVVLIHAVIDGSNLKNAKLRKADLRLASLIGADLRGADLEQANLSSAKLSHADLSDALLTNEALLVGAHLDGAILKHANLEYVDATGADFTDAILINAKLGRAVLTRANFTRANLSGAQLRHANLEKARSLSGFILDGAVMDETTRTQIDERRRERG